MPNTLAHIGLQAPLTRLGIKEAPLQWIAVGCIIPDIPWIVQRIFMLLPGIDTLGLRLYAVTQASLLYCLFLSAALAMLSRQSKQVFLILATNSLLHLLLDASQTKWGNGVNLLVPFSWQTTAFELFWPEHILSYLFTFMGTIVFLSLWRKAIRNDLLLQKPHIGKAFCATLCLLFYLCSPLLFIQTAYDANIHFSKTLCEKTKRTGKRIELDRARYNATHKTLECYIGKQLKVTNLPEIKPGPISIRGYFLDEHTIAMQEYHIHTSPRDYASYAGLLLTLLLWGHSLFFQRSLKATNRTANEK